MSFWKFGFAQSSTNAIDTILNALPSTSSSGTFTNATLTSDERAKIESALDQLLDNADLLNELKSGSNQRLIDFIARAEVVNRLAGWVLWGLGGAHPGQQASSTDEDESAVRPEAAATTASKAKSATKPDEKEKDRQNSVVGGIVSDDIQDGKVPPEALITITRTTEVGYGGVPVRKAIADDQQATPVVEKAGTEDKAGEGEKSDEEKWSKRPRLATEILCGDVPSLDNILFEPDAATTQPARCPRSPEAFLVPFWDTLLRSTEEQLESHAVQVGYWTRINIHLLSGPRHAEVLKVVLSIPHLLQRLLALIPNCSPLSDLLLLILRNAPTQSNITQHAIPAIVRLLDPFASGGVDAHFAADELLRGIIDQCSAVPIQPQTGFGPSAGPANGATNDGPTMEWRDTFLARQIADEKTVRQLTQWMFDVDAFPFEAAENQVTPKIPSRALPALTPKNDPTAALRTSSLVHSIAVLVDLIRKNNSDFVEQQMLNWARLYTQRGDDEQDEDENGPSLVDLSSVLKILTERLPDFQNLLAKPRTLVGDISTTAGKVEPLTIERYRICELYAEMLHCSNMGLTNRTKSPFVDASGRLRPEWRDPEKLGTLLAEALRLPAASSESSGDSNPVPGSLDLPRLSSGFSTPSGAGSLDSESGVLTRAEAKELHDLIAASAGNGHSGSSGDDDEADPFGDQFESSSDEELAGAVDAIQLDEDLTASPDLYRSPPAIASPSLTGQHNNSNSTGPQLKTYLPPGPSLKVAFIQHGVIPTMLDLFFRHQLNNFLHNVVFDVVQQIFHGRLDRPLDRQLAISVLTEAKLVDRILEAQKANDNRPPKTPRAGYMGHMTLIAEEVVKLFQRQPTTVYSVVEKKLPQPAWYEYVTSVLKDTRERETRPLGGGVSEVVVERELPGAPALLEDDDEFPMNSSRSMRAQETDRTSSKPVTPAGTGASEDQFSRYLVQTMAGDEFGSSDEDDDDPTGHVLGEFGASHFSEGDFDLNIDANPLVASSASSMTGAPSATSGHDRGQPKFGFDDRFDEAETSNFRPADTDSDDEDDADWGQFTSPSNNELDKSDFPSTLEKAGGFGDDDDFGDFEEGTPGAGTPIVLPKIEDQPDFDFAAAQQQRHDEVPVAAESIRSVSSPTTMPRSPPLDADKATSLDEPLGPSMHAGARLDEFGRVEAVVDGHTVVVPADDIALAHHMAQHDSAIASPGASSPARIGSPQATRPHHPQGGTRRSSEETRRRRSSDGQPPELSTL